MELVDLKVADVGGLLMKVKSIIDKNNTVLDATGNRYNIFKILALNSDEQSFSRFIANLLEVKGTHGHGIQFLYEFIETINSTLNNETVTFDYDKAKIYREFSIGPRNDSPKEPDKATGGRIDILITIPDRNGVEYAYIIENKIFAEDQNTQLIRYKNFGESKYPNRCSLIYLTLNGSDPSVESTNFIIKDPGAEENEQIAYWQNISYSIEIKEWLEKCRNIASRFPYVRETLNQFINQINDLTGVTMNENEIFELLTNQENAERAELLSKSYSTIKVTQARKIIHEARSIIEAKIGKENETKKHAPGLSNCERVFSKAAWKFLSLKVILPDGDLNKLIIDVGFKVNNLDENKKTQIRDIFASEGYLPDWNDDVGLSVRRKLYKQSYTWIGKKDEIMNYIRLALEKIIEFEENGSNSTIS